MTKKEDFIKCPNCGWEYTLAEIFYPKYVLGNPKDIERTSDGKIVEYYGHSPELEETYKCDNCSCSFKTHLAFSHTSELLHTSNELEDFVQPLYSDRLFLKED